MVKIDNYHIYNYTSHPITFGHREGDKIIKDFELPQDGVINVETIDETEHEGIIKVYKRRYRIPTEVMDIFYDTQLKAYRDNAIAVIYVSSTVINALRLEGYKPPKGLIIGGVKNIAPRGQKPVAQVYAILSI